MLVAYVLHALFGLGGHRLDGFYLKWVTDAIALLSASMCMWRAVAVRGERVAWALFGLGMTSWGLGNIYYSIFLVDKHPVPIPSVADALFLGTYPPVFVGLVLLSRSRIRDVGLGLSLDGIIPALGIAAVSSAVVVQAVLQELGAREHGSDRDESRVPVVRPRAARPRRRCARAERLALRPDVGSPRRRLRWCSRPPTACFSSSLRTGHTSSERSSTPAGYSGAVLVSFAAWAPVGEGMSVRRGSRLLAGSGFFGLVGLAILIWDHFHHVNTLALALALARRARGDLPRRCPLRRETRQHAKRDDAARAPEPATPRARRVARLVRLRGLARASDATHVGVRLPRAACSTARAGP